LSAGNSGQPGAPGTAGPEAGAAAGGAAGRGDGEVRAEDEARAEDEGEGSAARAGMTFSRAPAARPGAGAADPPHAAAVPVTASSTAPASIVPGRMSRPRPRITPASWHGPGLRRRTRRH
jgi:hypothetical protein